MVELHDWKEEQVCNTVDVEETGNCEPLDGSREGGKWNGALRHQTFVIGMVMLLLQGN